MKDIFQKHTDSPRKSTAEPQASGAAISEEAPLDLALTSPFYSIQQKLHLLLQMGQLLMENGADTDRIQRDTQRAAAHMGIEEEQFHQHIMYTTLLLNVNDKAHSYTEFRKTIHHGVNLTAISALSKLTWRALRENYSLQEFEANLNRIATRPGAYPFYLAMLGAGAACGGFCKLFGGSWLDSFLTLLAASFGFLVRHVLQRSGLNIYATITLTACSATLAAWATQFLTGTVNWYPLIACSLFLVPGIPLLNAVSDFLNNFIVGGMTRAMHTVLVASSMTLGIFIAIRLAGIPDFTGVSLRPDTIYFSQAVAAAISAVGFSILFNVPPRLLVPVAIGGIITVLIRNVAILELDCSQAFASLLGAAFVGLLALRAIHWFHTPNIVLTLPSAIPMIPGVLIFRLLFALLNIHDLSGESLLIGVRSGVEAVMIIIAIAVGVAIPNIFLHRYIKNRSDRTVEELLSQRYEED